MPMTVQLSSQNPWPGLRPFTEKDRDFFFGREREIAELLELVEQSPAVVLYGQSGLGKTSLIQAGLFPELKRLDFLPFRIRFDHSEDAPPLAEQIKTALTDELDRAGVHAPRPTPEETLWEYFHRRDLDLWGPGNRLLTPVIVVDQFEEVFTLGQRSEKAAARVAQFAADLESVLEHRAPQAVRERLDKSPDEALRYDFRRQSSKFLLSLREDFLGYLDSWCRRIPSLLSVTNRFRLQAMTGAQALEVVERGGRDLVDDAVAQDIVGFVSDARHRVAPALLSVVLEELNHRRVEHGQPRITAEFLSGERGKIIQDFYERSFEGIDPRVRVWVEDRLLTGGGHRQSAALEDALTQGISESECNLLVNRRVLHRTEREGVVWLELTHDLLSDPASRSRAQREQRRQAEEAARQKEQFRRELGKSRRLAAVFGVLLVVALAACLLAVFYIRKANKSELKRQEAFQNGADIANHLSIGVVSNSWVPVATVEATIKDAENAYQKLGSQGAASSDLGGDVGIAHARFLARAADVLYEGGHFAEGLRWSSEAMIVLYGLGPAVSKGEQARIARAEILYEEGRGSLAMNKLNDAAVDFTKAITLISSVPKWKAKEDTSRVFILSHIGLGDRYSNPCTMSQAVTHFKMAYLQAHLANGAAAGANHTDPDRDEAAYLEIRALLELGASQWDPLQQQSWDSTAQTALQNAEKGDRSNPRWKALSAELAYDQAQTASTLDQSDQAQSKLNEAAGDYQDLINRDPLNWQWQLSLAWSRHLLAQVYINLKEWDLAEGLLNQSMDSATELIKYDNQTGWARANSLRADNLESLSTIPVLRALESNFEPETVSILESSFLPLSQADSILRTMQSSASPDSGCSVELAEIAQFRGLIQDLQGILSWKDVAKQKTLYQESLASYLQSMKVLQAIERSASQSNPNPEPRFLKAKAEGYNGLADVQGGLKRQADAIASQRNSIATYRQLVHTAPTAGNYKRLSDAIKSLGDLYEGKKDYLATSSQYEQAMSALDVAIDKASKQPGQQAARGPQYSDSKAKLYGALAEADIARGVLPRALSEIGNELDTIWKAYPADFTNHNYLDDLNSCKSRLDSIQVGLQSSDPQPPYRSLNPGQKKALLAQVEGLSDRTKPLGLLESSGGVWPLPPLFPGAWRTLAGSEYGSEGVLRELAATRRDVTPARVLGIRGLILDFYGDSHLYEVAADGLHGTLFYLRRGQNWVQLKGNADAIKEMNGKSSPQLDTVERAAAYLRFYLGTVQNSDLGPDLCKPSPESPFASSSAPPPVGLYSLIDQEPDVPWLDSATAQQRAGAAKKIQPLTVEESPNHEWQARGTLECGGDLFHVSFWLSRSGILNASQANRIDDHLPVKAQFFSVDNLRTEGTIEDLFLDALKRNPADESALQALMDIFAANKEYEKEEQVLLDIMKRSPSNQTALGGLVDLYGETKQPKKEESLLLEAIEQDPSNRLAVEDLAGLYEQAGENGKKEALFLSVLKQEPESGFALEDLKSIYSEGHEYGKEEALLLGVLKQDPANETALSSLPRVYFNAKDWNDAVHAEDNWIAHVQRRKVTTDYSQENLNRDLSDADTSRAWYQIFARDFTGALASSDAAIKLNPTGLDPAVKRAEALLFLNRNQEADAIFLGNRGKDNGWQRWEDLVLNDFDVLEKAGLTNPEMTRLRPLLSAKPENNPAAPAPGSPQQNVLPN